ncbi:hypothetical protein ACROYT_G026852 [Oculina patagonica]
MHSRSYDFLYLLKINQKKAAKIMINLVMVDVTRKPSKATSDTGITNKKAFKSNKPSAGFNTVFRSSSSSPTSSSGFKPISVQKSFQAVPPPPPTEFAPPLPSEPAPPLPDEPVPPPPPPPPGDQQTKKPFSFKMGLSSGEQSQAKTSESTTPAKQGLSFSLGKKKGAAPVQFGVKSKPAKSTASAFAESSSEEEEEEEMPEEDSRVSFENEQLSSTATQQQDTLEKVIEYADTLRLKEALRPKLLIRFVKGTEQGGILPGTIPTSDEEETKKETASTPRKFTEFKEGKESKQKNKEDNSKDSGNWERDAKDRKQESYYKERLKDCKDEKDYSDRGNDSERTRDRKEDKYKYKQSRDYEERKESRKKDSRDRKNEKCDYKRSRDVDEYRDTKKSSSRKRDSSEGKRGSREAREDSYMYTTKEKEERTRCL